MDRAECRTQDAEFSGPQILGSRILCHDRRSGRGGDPGIYPKPRTGRSAIGSVRAEGSQPPRIQSIVLTSLKTAFGGSQSNLQLCWRLLARISQKAPPHTSPIICGGSEESLRNLSLLSRRRT